MAKISYSQYTKWANCPMAWKLHYVDEHKLDGDSIHTLFGTAMHEVIQEWLVDTFDKSDAVAGGIDLSGKLKTKIIEQFKDLTKTNESGEPEYICDKPTLMEFYTQGCQILEYIQKNRKAIFPTKDVELTGIEFPLSIEVKPNVWFTGFIDIVTTNKKTGKVTIYDIKTSKSGWGSYQKSDPVKIHQLLLYKKFYAETKQITEDMIDVEYIILKRVIFESNMYKNPRVSKFLPSQGSPSVKKAWNAMQEFINECFDDTGNHKTDTIKHKASKETCKFCVYKDRKDLCPYGVN